MKIESLNNFRVLNLGNGEQGNRLAYITENFYMYDVCFNIVIVSDKKSNSLATYVDTSGDFICIANYNYIFKTVEKKFNLSGVEFYFVADNPKTPNKGRGRIAIKIPESFKRITLLTHLSQYDWYDYRTPVLFKPEYVDNLPAHKYLLIQ